MTANIWIVSTGTELTRGYSKDTNSSEIAQFFVEEGFYICGITILPDNKEILINSLNIFLQDSLLHGIIFTGGLGPTDDDYTIEVFHSITRYPIVEDEYSLEKIKKLTEIRNLNLEITRKQARILKNSKILQNKVGLAPGMILEYNHKLIAILPGVPAEMRSMLFEVRHEFLKKFPRKDFYYKEIFYIYNEPESEFQKNLNLIQNKYQTNLSWGVSANPGFLKVFLETEKSLEQEFLKAILGELQKLYQDQFLKEPLEHVIHKTLIRHKKKLAIAESCTGGFLSKLITDSAGSSEYFLGSIISYSNDFKKNLLEVSEETLSQYGSVSKECAVEMLKGLIQKTKADLGISITGIAGPSGGTKEKPVGLVYIGVYVDSEIEIHKLFFPSSRDRIREYTIYTALFFLFKKLKRILQIE